MSEARDVGTSLEEASARAAGSDRAPAPLEDRESELPSSAAFATEDFLYHLYRGSELLQDNRVGEAKDELERALSMQPRDIEGQGLLGVVYFRLGMYPRAITIYEEIVKARPQELTPRLNLGLCYLKTGQLPRAKETLEDLIRHKPEHARAWGYLGLVYERMGELEKAIASFERARQPNMVRRLQRQLDLTKHESGPSREVVAVREVAAEAMHELEADARDFSSDPQHGSVEPGGRGGRWHSVELGEELMPPPSRPLRPRALGVSEPRAEQSDQPAPAAARPAPAGVTSPRRLAEELVLTLAEGVRVERRSPEMAFFRLQGPFAVRLEHVRAMAPEGDAFTSVGINRRARGRELDEPLGGMRAPLVVVSGAGALVLTASPSLLVAELAGEFLFVREDRLVGFDTTLRHESGRLATGAVEHVPVVQLSGAGLVVLRAGLGLSALEVGGARSAVVRGADVVGWIGRLLPQTVPAAEAPGAAPGFVAFAGDGAVFVDPHWAEAR